MWPATNVSWLRFRICVLNVIVPSFRTLITVWPFAVDVEPVVSLLAVNLAWRTHIVPRPFFAGALLATGAAAAQATSKQRIKRRIWPHSLSRSFGLPQQRWSPVEAVF